MLDQDQDPLPKFASRYCSDCGQYKVIFAEDGQCADCADGPQVDEARKREGRRSLYEHTAALLHQIGRHDRAAWYEDQLRDMR